MAQQAARLPFRRARPQSPTMPMALVLGGGVAATAATVARTPTGPAGVAVTVVCALAWTGVIALTGLHLHRTSARTPLTRVALWISMVLGAYGQATLGALIRTVDGPIYSDVTGWTKLAVTGTLQAATIVALCGVWAALARTSEADGPTTPHAPYQTQHQRLATANTFALYIAGWIGAHAAWATLQQWHISPRGSGTALSPPTTAAADINNFVFAALAGPYEELGLTVLTALLLLGPTLTTTRSRLVTVLAITVTLRSIGHLYYARGDLESVSILPIPDRAASALGIVIWCAIWAGGAFLVFLRFRRPWAIAAAHSAPNLITVSGDLIGRNPAVALTLATLIVTTVAVALLRRHIPPLARRTRRLNQRCRLTVHDWKHHRDSTFDAAFRRARPRANTRRPS